MKKKETVHCPKCKRDCHIPKDEPVNITIPNGGLRCICGTVIIPKEDFPYPPLPKKVETEPERVPYRNPNDKWIPDDKWFPRKRMDPYDKIWLKNKVG